ncbi:MAG TPA: hypothetical protein VGK27_03830 [Candidatus Deferrimicrobiaceae bacterium]
MSGCIQRRALTALVLLALTIVAVPAFADTYKVSMTPVTTYSDGTPFETGKIVTYTVYWTTDPTLTAGSLKPVATGTGASTVSFDPTTAGMTRGTTVYFTAKSVLSTGEVSKMAAGVSWYVPKRAPGTPGHTQIIKL